MSGAMAFLAGMGAGYMTQKQRNLENDRLAADDKRKQDAFQMQKVTFDQTKSDREAAITAGAPQEVTPEQGPPTEAQYAATPAGQEPDAIGYRVGNGIGAKDFATRGLADTAATQQATPQARRTRMADLAAQGNTFASTALTNDMQREASQMTINKGHREEANQVFDQGIKTALQTGGPQALADFMSNSPADGQGGAIKFKAVISPDGKSWQMNRVGDDGSITPFSQSFASDEGGMAIAGMMLSRAVPDSEKVKHLMAEKEIGLKDKKEVSEAALRAATANKDNAWAAALQPGGTKDKSGSAVDRMTEIDKTTIVNINKQRDTIHSAIVKAQAEENYDPTKPGAKELTEQLAALGIKEAQIQSKYGDAQATPDPQGLRKPAPAASESKLRAQAAGNMGADPKAIQREIDAATADLKKVTDPGSKEQLQTHINDLKRQAGNLPADTQAAAIATRPAPTPREIAATRGSSPVTGAPTLAPSAPAMASRGVQAPAPSYDQWMAAKNVKDQLINNANQMSPENRDNYLRNRLPQIEQAIEFNQNYKKY